MFFLLKVHYIQSMTLTANLVSVLVMLACLHRPTLAYNGLPTIAVLANIGNHRNQQSVAIATLALPVIIIRV